MHFFRISHQNFLTNLSGTGASYQDGARWNSPGNPVVYFAGSSSVAMLEMANYIPNPKLIPKQFKLGIYGLEKPTDIEKITVKNLPDQWNSYPHHAHTKFVGDEWLVSGRTALLEVPSASVPDGLESIFLLNPRHPESQFIKLIKTVDQIYSERMFSGFKP